MQSEEDTPIQNKFKDLCAEVQNCEDERVKNKKNLSNIEKTYQRIQQVQKLSPYYKSKLKGMYNEAKQDAENEAELLRKALDTIKTIRTMDTNERIRSRHAVPPREPMSNGALMMMLQVQGESLPVWFGKRGESPPALCGNIPAPPNYVAGVNDMVAANVKSSNDEDAWIMARVVKYFSSTRKYEVEDVDEEQTERHTLSRRKVIPLPRLQANPETHPEALFPADTLVLAAYPQLTCLYPAIIKCPPAKLHAKYEVLFKDSSFKNGIDTRSFEVSQMYVIHFKEKRRK